MQTREICIRERMPFWKRWARKDLFIEGAEADAEDNFFKYLYDISGKQDWDTNTNLILADDKLPEDNTRCMELLCDLFRTGKRLLRLDLGNNKVDLDLLAKTLMCHEYLEELRLGSKNIISLMNLDLFETLMHSLPNMKNFYVYSTDTNIVKNRVSSPDLLNKYYFINRSNWYHDAKWKSELLSDLLKKINKSFTVNPTSLQRIRDKENDKHKLTSLEKWQKTQENLEKYFTNLTKQFEKLTPYAMYAQKELLNIFRLFLGNDWLESVGAREMTIFKLFRFHEHLFFEFYQRRVDLEFKNDKNWSDICFVHSQLKIDYYSNFSDFHFPRSKEEYFINGLKEQIRAYISVSHALNTPLLQRNALTSEEQIAERIESLLEGIEKFCHAIIALGSLGLGIILGNTLRALTISAEILIAANGLLPHSISRQAIDRVVEFAFKNRPSLSPTLLLRRLARSFPDSVREDEFADKLAHYQLHINRENIHILESSSAESFGQLIAKHALEPFMLGILCWRRSLQESVELASAWLSHLRSYSILGTPDKNKIIYLTTISGRKIDANHLIHTRGVWCLNENGLRVNIDLFSVPDLLTRSLKDHFNCNERPNYHSEENIYYRAASTKEAEQINSQLAFFEGAVEDRFDNALIEQVTRPTPNHPIEMSEYLKDSEWRNEVSDVLVKLENLAPAASAPLPFFLKPNELKTRRREYSSVIAPPYVEYQTERERTQQRLDQLERIQTNNTNAFFNNQTREVIEVASTQPRLQNRA